jgi:hypothetical protein
MLINAKIAKKQALIVRDKKPVWNRWVSPFACKNLSQKKAA